jgi:hypothetical protein
MSSSLEYTLYDNTSETIISSDIKPDYQPEARKNTQMISRANITKNWEYRRHLTKNANEIRIANFMEAYDSVNYSHATKMQLTAEEQCHGNGTPHLKRTGNPYGTPTSDLKTAYYSESPGLR